MNRPVLLSFALACISAALPAQPAETPEKAVREFYTAYQKSHFSGLPSSKMSRRLSVYLSPALLIAMDRARAEQSRCSKAFPGDKGPWVEGDMFSSNFEGFTTLRVEDSGVADAGGHRLTLHFDYVDGGKTFSWTDQVSLVRQDGKRGARWLIDDVIYRRQEGFGNGFGSTLRQALSDKGC